MDFDHREGKNGDISQMVFTHSPEKLLREIALCDVVCANCHRVRTHIGRAYVQPQLPGPTAG
jgi:hypothetical protein